MGVELFYVEVGREYGGQIRRQQDVTFRTMMMALLCNWGQKYCIIVFKVPYDFFTLSIPHAHSHKHSNSSQSIHDQTLYALVHNEETMPGMNCTTSVFSVPKLNLMLLLHCDKITPHRPAATQMRHTLEGHFLHPSANYRRLTLIVILCFYTLFQLLSPFLENLDNCTKKQNGDTDRFSPPHQPAWKQSLIINLPCFDRNRQADTHIHSDTFEHIDADIVCFICAMFSAFS